MYSEFEVFGYEEQSIIIKDLKRLWQLDEYSDDSKDEQPLVYPI